MFPTRDYRHATARGVSLLALISFRPTPSLVSRSRRFNTRRRGSPLVRISFSASKRGNPSCPLIHAISRRVSPSSPSFASVSTPGEREPLLPLLRVCFDGIPLPPCRSRPPRLDEVFPPGHLVCHFEHMRRGHPPRLIHVILNRRGGSPSFRLYSHRRGGETHPVSLVSLRLDEEGFPSLSRVSFTFSRTNKEGFLSFR